MADVTLSGFGDNIFAGSISADRIFYNDAVGFYDPKSVTNQNRLTNADRIRAMSDEELAKFFPSTASEWACHPGATEADCRRVGGWWEGCPRCWLDWLKQEVEG